MTYEPINLGKKFSRFTDHWAPRIVAEMNDYQFKLVKLQSEFVWHSHADTDEAFIVVDGEMTIEFRDGSVKLVTGEMLVVRKDVEHRPAARGNVRSWLSNPEAL